MDAGDIANVRGWLTTVVARVCIDLEASPERLDDVEIVFLEP